MLVPYFLFLDCTRVALYALLFKTILVYHKFFGASCLLTRPLKQAPSLSVYIHCVTKSILLICLHTHINLSVIQFLIHRV